ncbi:hypothetical protein LC607_33680 [Nostoc sp. CHAB 5824]|nr:hypothetical protein [Nostoc sp. CHAB 5824]
MKVYLLRLNVHLLRFDVDLLRLNVHLLRFDVHLLRLNFDLLRFDVDLLRLNIHLLRLNVDLLRLDFDLLKLNAQVLTPSFSQYSSISLFTLRRSPQPPFKRGANFILYPLFKGVATGGGILSEPIALSPAQCPIPNASVFGTDYI